MSQVFAASKIAQIVGSSSLACAWRSRRGGQRQRGRGAADEHSKRTHIMFLVGVM
jgi:hypothetical protein